MKKFTLIATHIIKAGEFDISIHQVVLSGHSYGASPYQRKKCFVYLSTTINAMGATSRIGVPFASNLVIMRATINTDPHCKMCQCGK